MDIEKHLHVAEWIASEAETETLDTYKGNLDRYRDLGYTYIPIPSAKKYYNLRENTLVEMGSEQIIHSETHLMDVLRLMKEKPFILIDLSIGSYYIVTESGEYVAPVSIGDPDQEFPDKERVAESFGPERWDVEETVEYLTDDELATNHPELAKEHTIDSEHLIITLSDLNKREMKEMMYSVFAKLTSELSRRIENQHPDSEEILRFVSEESVGRWKKERLDGKVAHIAEYTTLSDMIHILKGSNSHFVNACGFESKNDIDNLRKIIDIRNHVMHPNRSLVYDRSDIPDILDAVNEAQAILSDMK